VNFETTCPHFKDANSFDVYCENVEYLTFNLLRRANVGLVLIWIDVVGFPSLDGALRSASWRSRKCSLVLALGPP